MNINESNISKTDSEIEQIVKLVSEGNCDKISVVAFAQLVLKYFSKIDK